MSVRSAPSAQMTLLTLLSSTPSQGSEPGPTLFGLLAGLTTAPSGPEAAPVSPSPSPVRVEAPPTSATSGPSGSASFASAALSRSLGSRLQVLTASRGSTLFTLTWKEQATPSGRPFFLLRGSALRTYVTGSSSVPSGWPTPSASMDSGNTGTAWEARREAVRSRGINGNGFGLILPMAAQLASWRTPMSTDGSKQDATLPVVLRRMERRQEIGLAMQARLVPWPTPNARDFKHGPRQTYEERGGGRKGESLGNLVSSMVAWPTLGPKDGSKSVRTLAGAEAETARKGWDNDLCTAALGTVLTGSPAATENPGQLNPAHSRWLMGLPPEWDACAPTETRLSRRSPRLS